MEYTYKDNNDMSMIDKRKRMLGRFLSRIIVHPVLSQEHIFHRFIYGTESWVKKKKKKKFLINSNINI